MSDRDASNALVSSIQFYAGALARAEERAARAEALLRMTATDPVRDELVAAALAAEDSAKGNYEQSERLEINPERFVRLERAADAFRRRTAERARPAGAEDGAVEPAGGAARRG